jgi:hypothetical protein
MINSPTLPDNCESGRGQVGSPAATKVRGRGVKNSFHLYCVSNGEITLEHDLVRSPDIIAGSVSVTVIRGARAAAYGDRTT